LETEEIQENFCRDGRLQDLPGTYWHTVYPAVWQQENAHVY
jgi:hypothetical protein